MNHFTEENNLIWLKEEIYKSDKTKVTAFFTEFKNANIIFLTDADYKIGTIALAAPMKLNSTRQVGSSTIPLLFGVKNEFITRAIAEKVANKTNKLSIAITNLISTGKNNYKVLFELINKLIKE